MNQDLINYMAEFISSFIEFFAMILIGATIVVIIINNSIHLIGKCEQGFQKWKNRSWRAIQGSLDLLVTADLLSTITIDRNMQSVITLGILLIIRTLISWSLEVEIEGCWPWQKKVLSFKEK